MYKLKPCSFCAPLCGASLCAGAPRVQAGAQPRTDGQRNQLCELCGRRLSKVKHTTKCGVGKKCHPRCKPSKHAINADEEPKPVAARSHKKSPSAAGKMPLPPPPLLLHQLPLFPSHAWSIQESNRRSRATAKSWHELATSSELKLWDEKRTKYWQHDCRLQLTCSFEDEKRVRLLSGSEAIARGVLSRLGVKATHSDLRCDAVKLLRSRKGEGLQDVHYDVPVYSVAITTYAVLIYLTDTVSTAFSRRPLVELRDTFTVGEIRPSSAALKKLARSEFHSARVTRGTVAVIRGDVPHYAEVNPDEADRYVLFLHFSHPSLSTQKTSVTRMESRTNQLSGGCR